MKVNRSFFFRSFIYSLPNPQDCVFPVVRLCRMQQVCDRPMTSIVLCKSNQQLAHDCCVSEKIVVGF